MFSMSAGLCRPRFRQVSVVGSTEWPSSTLYRKSCFSTRTFTSRVPPHQMRPILEGNMTKIQVEKQESLRVEIEGFIDAIEKEGKDIVTGEEATENLRLALAFIESAKSGQVLEFEPGLGTKARS